MDTKTVLSGFIVLEGLDGSGTTTQMRLLEKRFAERGMSGWFTCEPSSGFVGKTIRRILQKELTADPRTLALLFAADRNEHLYGPGGIVEQLGRHDYVVSDRYIFSSLAYQCSFSGFDYVAGINAPFPLPEYLFFLDLDPEECQNRMNGRDRKDIFEEVHEQEMYLSWYRKGIEAYGKSGMKVTIIDASESADDVLEKIWRILASGSIYIR